VLPGSYQDTLNRAPILPHSVGGEDVVVVVVVVVVVAAAAAVVVVVDDVGHSPENSAC